MATSLEAARQRSQDLMTLFNVDESIRAERNMQRLLSRVTRTMAERAGASARSAYLRDKDGVLRLEYAAEGTGRPGTAAPAFALRVAQAEAPLTASPAEAQEFGGQCRR
ncbi:hypothetical protein ACFP81_09365 [Deinococcus lacus]|uniref:Uncharacterized protein n=1 Tax=Deinococcus lacus TaxID=392561 RepID=A0ABW1YD65_9DEIO